MYCIAGWKQSVTDHRTIENSRTIVLAHCYRPLIVTAVMGQKVDEAGWSLQAVRLRETVRDTSRGSAFEYVYILVLLSVGLGVRCSQMRPNLRREV